MDQKQVDPPLGAAGPGDACSKLTSLDNPDNSLAPTAGQAELADISLAAASAKVDLLIEDIGDNAGAMITQLNVVLAMREAGDATGLLYSLRRARAYWKALSGSAADLVAVEAGRLSILRQAEAP